MAVAAETKTTISNPEQQFGYSLRAIEAMGRFSCEAAGVELEQAREEAWHDFVTGVQENVVISSQDKDDEATAAMRERLRFDPMRTMEIRDGYVVTSRGEPMVSICEAGVTAARTKATEDEPMQSEVERAENDVLVARAVDNLAVGELMAVVCMEPLEAMDRDGDEFWRNVSVIGYKRGLAVLQVYYRESGTSMQAGAYSVKGSSKAAFQQLLAEHGVHVPLDTPANDWITHPIYTRATPEEAQAFGATTHRHYQQIIGKRAADVSVTQLIKENHALVRAYFDVFIDALATANATRTNNQTMQGLAAALLGRDANLFSANDRRSMMRVVNSRTFTAADTIFMEKTIRYACTEELWKILLEEDVQPLEAGAPGSVFVSQPVIHDAAAFQNRAASRVRTGVALGRSGGGCSGLQFERPEGTSDGENTSEDLGQQDIFGGNTEESESTDGQPLACAYTHDQCYCSPYDTFGNPLGVRKMVVAYRDKQGIATCLRDNCGAQLNPKGKVLSYGDIYKLAQQKAAAKAETVQNNNAKQAA
jgi:uncharacterized protein (DUF2267 family)